MRIRKVEELNKSNDYDFTQDSFLDREYVEPSDLLSIEEAERIIGKRPDITKPKQPTSKNPKPETIKKYKDDLIVYKNNVEKLDLWESDYNKLVDLTQQLQNTRQNLDELEDALDLWCSRHVGFYVIRVGRDRYSLIQDPVKIVREIEDNIKLPSRITSVNDKPSWYIDDIDFFEEENNFSFVTVDVGKEKYTIIAIPDSIPFISDVIESYVDTIQPKNILSFIEAQLDHKTQKTLEEWRDKGLVNSNFPEDMQDLKLFLTATAFLKEIQQLNKYPSGKAVGKLVNYFLSKI